MIQNLDKILEYQKIDIELRKVLDEIERSDDSKKLEQARAEFNNAKVSVTESEKAAESVVSFFHTAMATYEEYEHQIVAIGEELGKSDDIERQRELAAQLESMRDKLIELERKIVERVERTDKVIMSYLEGNERGKKMRAVYANIKDRLEKFRQEREPKMKELHAKLDALRGDIPPEWMKTYKAITADRKYPAFVAAIPGEKKEYRCFCGFTLSQKTKSELLEKGFCRCETCQRLIYRKQ